MRNDHKLNVWPTPPGRARVRRWHLLPVSTIAARMMRSTNASLIFITC